MFLLSAEQQNLTRLETGVYYFHTNSRVSFHFTSVYILLKLWYIFRSNGETRGIFVRKMECSWPRLKLGERWSWLQKQPQKNSVR